MTLDEMAAELRKSGWTVMPPWTKENCDHPPDLRVGQGTIASDGSGSYSWHCRKCGHSENHMTPPDPKRKMSLIYY